MLNQIIQDGDLILAQGAGSVSRISRGLAAESSNLIMIKRCFCKYFCNIIACERINRVDKMSIKNEKIAVLFGGISQK